MNGLAEKHQKGFIVAAMQVQTRIAEDPIVFPVVIVNAMLPDITGCILETPIVRRQSREIVETREEFRLFESAMPDNVFEFHCIEDVASCEL